MQPIIEELVMPRLVDIVHVLREGGFERPLRQMNTIALCDVSHREDARVTMDRGNLPWSQSERLHTADLEPDFLLPRSLSAAYRG